MLKISPTHSSIKPLPKIRHRHRVHKIVQRHSSEGKKAARGFGNLVNRIKITPQPESDVPPSMDPEKIEQPAIKRDFLTSKEFLHSWQEDTGGMATLLRRAAKIPSSTGKALPVLTLDERAEIEAAILNGKDPRPQVFIQSQKSLEVILQLLSAETELIAMDLEFSNNVGSFMPTLELMQLSTPHGFLAVIDFKKLGHACKPLIDIINSKEIILHGGDQDLMVLHQLVFQHDVPCIPAKARDTQIIAGFLGLHHQLISLAKLVQDVIGVTVPKGLGQSDWSTRPLDVRQIHYAFNDVRYLHLIYDIMMKKIDEAGPLSCPIHGNKSVSFDRHQVVEEELTLNTTKDRTPKSPDESWKPLLQRIDLAEFDSGQIEVIKALCKWRDIQAYRKNRAPTAMLRNETVTQLAKSAMSADDIKKFYANIPFVVANAHVLEQLIAAVNADLVKTNVTITPTSIITSPLDGLEGMSMHKVKTTRLESSIQFTFNSLFDIITQYIAQENKVTPSNIAQPSQLKELVVYHQELLRGTINKSQFDSLVEQSPLMRGFRKELLGKHLLAMMNGDELSLKYHNNKFDLSIIPKPSQTRH